MPLAADGFGCKGVAAFAAVLYWRSYTVKLFPVKLLFFFKDLKNFEDPLQKQASKQASVRVSEFKISKFLPSPNSKFQNF